MSVVKKVSVIISTLWIRIKLTFMNGNWMNDIVYVILLLIEVSQLFQIIYCVMVKILYSSMYYVVYLIAM